MRIKVGYAEDVVGELHGDGIEEGCYYTYYYACCQRKKKTRHLRVSIIFTEMLDINS